MFISTKRIPKLAGLALIVLAAACSSDSVSSPSASAKDVAMNVVAPAMPNEVLHQATPAKEVELSTSIRNGHSTMAAVYPSNAVTYQFTVNPTMSQSFVLGTHLVSFPASTICDPASSGYGSGTWLNSCPKLTAPITITATTWIDLNGRAQIDFANAIRFYPNSNGQLPAVYLRDPWAAMSSFGRIDYCSASGCVNEAASDTTLGTQRDSVTGYLFRLVRHFSGYNVWA